jgi:hypothetical protein
MNNGQLRRKICGAMPPVIQVCRDVLYELDDDKIGVDKMCCLMLKREEKV